MSAEEIPPAMLELYGEVRDLTDEEYAETYASGSGGHELPPDVLASLNSEAS